MFSPLLFDWLEDQRREAYVRAVMRQAESDDVVGYIGGRAPVALFEALGLMALPVYGVDGDIMRYSTDGGRGLCPIIESTLTYAKTDRCPLIHSSRLIVVDDACPVMAREMESLKTLIRKDVYIYRAGNSGEPERLTNKLEAVYGRRLTDESRETARSEAAAFDALLHCMKYHSSLTGLQVYILEYYLNFLPMTERLRIFREIAEGVTLSRKPVKFTPVRVQSGAGIYRQIDRMYSGRPYRIIEGEEPYDFVYASCPFHDGTRINY